MIGLIAIVVLLVLLTLATQAFARVFGIAQRRGKTNLVSAVWGGVAVLALSLPITWDAIPTWIAFEYYRKDAGLTVFKTLEQWKLENPGVAETLRPYAVGDERGESRNLGSNTFRTPLNERLVENAQQFRKPF